MSELSELTAAVNGLREQVVVQITECKACRGTVSKLNLDMYGTPGNGQKPGVMGYVASLLDSRHNIWIGLGILWSVAGALLIAGIVGIVRHFINC